VRLLYGRRVAPLSTDRTGRPSLRRHPLSELNRRKLSATRHDPSSRACRVAQEYAEWPTLLTYRPQIAFDPETITVLSAALEEAWGRLLQSGSECARPAYARAMREVVARRIIDMAQRGTKDKKELVEGAVGFLAANYRLEEKGARLLRKPR
jgi:hypothetical protein